MTDGQPILTSVIELVQSTSMSEVTTSKGCGAKQGDALLDCVSAAVEDKNAIWKAFPFPDTGARLMVRVDGVDTPASFVSKASWGTSGKDPLVGTAWLIALDASSMMGPRYEDARQVANQFIGALAPNDIAKLVIFDDRPTTFTAASGWVGAAQKATLTNLLTTYAAAGPSHQKDRPFSAIVQNITKSFGDIGNAGGNAQVPMHQAMVLLSNGAGRGDVNSPAAAASVMKQYFNKGRFPDDNPLAPKTPLPVITVYFPAAKGFTNDLYASNDFQFMQDLSNPEIGGFFDIVREKQGVDKARTILSLVKARFNNMWVVKWRLSCLNSTPEQTFNLIFQNTNPAVIPDGTFQAVPIGVDPTTWPLDINVPQTKAETDVNPVRPGGKLKVYGNFCWGGDKARAEAYFVPAGTKPDPNVNKSDPEVAKKAMQNLIAQNLKGTATDATDTYVEFQVPDEEKLLEGTGDNAVARLVIYDNKGHRASGYDEKTVLTLKAGKKSLNLPIILGAAGLAVVILLLIIVLLRGGGNKKGGRGGNPPPAPIVAGGGGGYGGGGAPPYGGGGYQPPPPGGGYGGGGGGYGAAPIDVPAPQAYAAPPPPNPPEPVGGGGYPLAASASGLDQVRCPNCNSSTPAQSAVCFSCGQPLPKNAPAYGAPPPPVAAPLPAAYPLTSQQPSALEPPPNPYGSGAGTGASIIGAAGQFAIRGGIEVKVGRDPAQCPIVLQEPRVSGVHSTLKFEGGQLLVRDEGSNNGTYVGGARLAPHTWTPIPRGTPVRFGPVEFSVRID